MSELRVDTITDELGTGSPDFPNGITVSNATFGAIDISGSTIESTPIGQVTPAAGDFTTLSADSVNIDGGTIDGTAVNATTLTASGDVNFDSGTLFVDASTNNVGVGVNTPSQPLSVKSSSAQGIGLIHEPTNTVSFRVDSFGTTGIGSGGNLRLFDADENQRITLDARQQTNREISLFAGGTFRVGTQGTERMRIDSSGNVLIGTTTLVGNGFSIQENGGDICLTVNRTSRTATTTLQQYRNPNGTVGSIQTAGTSTSYLTSSDYRLKENIQPITGALDKVQAMNPVTYDWKAGGKGEGFIAHELQEIAPYAVSGEKDGEDMQGVDYGKLTTLLVGAVKELTAKVEQLEAQLNAD